MRAPAILGLTALAAALGCAPTLPEGLPCARTLSAGPDDSSLVDALARARSGDCVVPAAGTYRWALAVPEGVTLVAGIGTAVVIEGAPADQAAITVSPGAQVIGIQVRSPQGVGILVDRGPAKLDQVLVDSAGTVALVAWCEDDCRPELLAELSEVELIGSQIGLWVRGAHLRMVGGRIAESRRSSLSFASGYGACASHGAALAMEGTRIEGNQNLGLLVDGDSGTSATLAGVEVRANQNRGIWLQGLQGTAQAPKVELDACVVEQNLIAGVGARASQGLRIRGGRIAGTVLGPVKTGLGEAAEAGDGIGLFEGTGAVAVEGVALEQNQRGQALVDQAGSGIVISGGSVTAGPGQLGIVVQHSSEAVQASGITTPAPGSELPFAAPLLQLPSR